MTSLDFLDTNVLLYALNNSAPAKHKIAQALVARAIAGEFSISTQVLAEFAAVALNKFRDRLTPKEVVTMLDTLTPILLSRRMQALCDGRWRRMRSMECTFTTG